ncbi:hypothetical protein C8046_17425 [Serinibacter arcticus]|uniref:Tetratricopeptide repeat protein n=1 Tax=Serinibacter arcticus TaxID=1655435 RepID=A0A2U1ZYU9_9MICO|nr:hypothetical protein [Serinibacter arcticus]PWD52157.1 hypothetical protein C8046_17425 [Serinibacter arcticus]
MSRTVDEANRAVGRIRRMPYGVARTEIAEQEARRIEEEGPAETLAYALFALVESYVWGGEGAKAYVPFRRSIRLWDTSPELFDEGDRHDFFWAFKWMVTGLVEYPDVPATQITATIADMERRYAVAGNGLDAVAYAAFRWAEHTGDPDVELAFTAWAATPRDEYSQCEACELGDQAVHLAATGRVPEAIRVIETVPPTTRWCATEPADMLSVLALAHLDQGDAGAALEAHRRAVAALADTQSDMVGARGRRLELLARGGATDRALEALASDGHLLVDADSPLGQLRFGIAVLRALAALPDVGERPVAVPGVPAATVGELGAWTAERSRSLAAAFDARNGSDRLVREVEAAASVRPSETPLSLTVIDPAAVAGTAPTVAAVTPPPGGSSSRDAEPAGQHLGGSGAGPLAVAGHDDASFPTAPAAPADAHLALAEEHLAADRPAQAVASYQVAAGLLDAAGRLADAGLAWAEAARCADLLGDVDGSHAGYVASTARLRAAGTPPGLLTRVVVAWAPVAARAGGAGDVLAVVGVLRPALRSLVEAERPEAAVDLVERERGAARRALADLDDTAARLLAAAPRRRPPPRGRTRTQPPTRPPTPTPSRSRSAPPRPTPRSGRSPTPPTRSGWRGACSATPAASRTPSGAWSPPPRGSASRGTRCAPRWAASSSRCCAAPASTPGPTRSSRSWRDDVGR